MADRRVLTDVFLKALAPTGERFDVWEEGNPGFGIRVGSKGGISFEYVYRAHGVSRRLTVGKYPLVSLSAARIAYHQAARAVAEGRDPADEKSARQVAAKEAMTVKHLCDSYILRYAKIQKRSWQEDERKLQREVVPTLGRRLISEVTRRDIAGLLDAKMDAGSPIAANRLLAVLSKMFGWAVERGELTVSPCIGIRKPAKEVSKDRVLVHSEIHPLWYALDTGRDVGMHLVTRRALQVMLLTGQRKGEVLRMRWEHVESSGDGHVWRIPAANAKSGKGHDVPLTTEVVTLLESVRVAMAGSFPASPWCFPSPAKPEQHVSLTAPDHAVRSELQRKNSPFKKLQPFTPHDLRRTVATGLSALGIQRLIVQKVLNHTDTSVTSVYDRYDYAKEKREALVNWGDMLIAATWPAGQGRDPETGEMIVYWDFHREWNRMPRLDVQVPSLPTAPVHTPIRPAASKL